MYSSSSARVLTNHSSLSTSLLGLKEDGFLVATRRAGLVRPRKLEPCVSLVILKDDGHVVLGLG
jgi:hypothetical protein